jgi:hypothetical protein
MRNIKPNKCDIESEVLEDNSNIIVPNNLRQFPISTILDSLQLTARSGTWSLPASPIEDDGFIEGDVAIAVILAAPPKFL